MKSTLATGALLAAANSASASTSASTPPGVVQFDVARRQPHPRLLRRSSTVATDISNDLTQGGYFIKCDVGTPAQTLTLQLDTGSSDIWVPASSASVCESSKSSDGCTLGSFDSSSSSTFVVVGEDEFSIEYVDGSHSTGDYFTDVFAIGSSSVTNMTMGLGSDTDIPYGLVGVGYKTDEAIVSDEESLSAAYDNLPIVMVSEGLINTNAYSLWLNDLDSSTGSLLFGGIDTAKYHGDLTRISIYKDSNTGVFTSFIVALTSVEATSSSGADALTSTGFPVAAVLDSGTTLSYLPQDLAEEIWTETGAVYNAEAGGALIPCSMASSGGYFSFGFGGPSGAVINVTMDELVLDLSTSGSAPTFASGKYAGQDACEFGIQNATTDPYLLGDTFLRSAYVVYDLVNNQIALAQTDFNATDSNIVAFASSGAAIPSATVAPSQAAVTATSAFTTPAYAAATGFSSSATSTGSSSSSSSSSGSKSAAGVLSVPLGLVGMAVFAVGGLFL